MRVEPKSTRKFWSSLRVMGAFFLLWGLFGHPARAQTRMPLPAEASLVPDKLLIFVHGYLSSASPMRAFMDQFARQGVSAQLLGDPGAPAQPYHIHAFDYGHFTRPGSDMNLSPEELARAFEEFYIQLPESCPICRRRAQRPVEVSLIAHSFGGVILREFLVTRMEQGRERSSLEAQAATGFPWQVRRVITTGSPYFGSTKTRLMQGFLGVLGNGLIRTALFGFIRPDAAGVFGNTIDAQGRALRLGSPYLWDLQQRWKRLLDREGTSTLPPWLVITAVGTASPARTGDGVVRFSAANLSPLFPGASMETLVVNLEHRTMVRLTRAGLAQREQAQMVAAIQHFILTGTLANAPAGLARPYALLKNERETQLLPWEQVPPEQELIPPKLYLPVPTASDPIQQEDFQQRMAQLHALMSVDEGDVWLRFYAGLPSHELGRKPPVLALSRPLSFFQNGVERSRDWTDRVARAEPNLDGEWIPTVQSLAPMRSHLISIPDLRPTGAYRLWVRLDHGVELNAEDVHVELEGGSSALAWQRENPMGIPLWLRPQQVNLVHVYLNIPKIRAEHPRLKRVEVREVALEPEQRGRVKRKPRLFVQNRMELQPEPLETP